MLRPHSVVVGSMSLACLVLADASAYAQWSHNPNVNLAIRVTAGDQGVPKVAATADGGCYIAWGDGTGNGWDTRLQRLDARGIPQWAAGGIVVADTTFSSTEDYGLAVDADGNAVLAYRDNSSGITQCEVQQVAPNGTMLWNPAGVQVSAVAANINGPRVCVTSDGQIVAAWSESGVAKLQRLNGKGAIQWTAGGIADTAPGGTYSVSDLQPSDNGGVIALYVKGAERHLYAQRFDSSGAKTWNAGNPVIVFNGSAIQFGYFPTFLPDGAGGGVFGWYETGGTRNVYVQRVNASGVEMYAHNGVPVSTSTASIGRLSPSIAFDQSAGDIYCFWTDVSLPVQSQWGVSGQKVNSAGVRQWGDAAISFIPLSGLQNAFVRVVKVSGGAIVACFDQPGAAANVLAFGVSSTGALQWTPTIVDACSVASSKGRLAATANAAGNRALLAWIDGRSDAGDIYAQNVNLNGSLGNPGDVNDDGVVDIDDLLAVISGWGACLPPPTFCAADVTPAPIGNGVIDIDDLLTVISNWG